MTEMTQTVCVCVLPFSVAVRASLSSSCCRRRSLVWMESSSLCLRLLISLRCSFIRSEPTTETPGTTSEQQRGSEMNTQTRTSLRIYLCDWCLTGTPKILKTGQLRVSPAWYHRPRPTMHCSPADWPRLSWLCWRPDCCWC